MSDQETQPLPRRPVKPGSAQSKPGMSLKGAAPAKTAKKTPPPTVTQKSKPVPPGGAKKASSLLGRRGLIAGCAALGALGFVALALAVLFLPPLGLAARLGGSQVLNAANPSVSHPDGISVSLTGEGTLRLRLDSTPREMFVAGDAERQHPGALAAIPSYLEMKSPLYILAPQGQAPVRVEVDIPNDSEPYHTLDLYQWDSAAGVWAFVPGRVDVAAGVIRSDALPENIAVFQTRPVTPLTGTVLERDETLDEISSSLLNLVMPSGYEVGPDGTVSGEPVGGWQPGAGYAIVPVVRAPDAAALAELLNNPASLALHVDGLRALAVDDPYNGIAIDYRGVSPTDRQAFTSFIADLGTRLDESGKVLVVVLPRPAGEPGAWDTGGYDWRAIGVAADLVLLDPGPHPGDYAINGPAITLLGWAVGEISRYKIHLASSVYSLDESEAALLSYEDALAALGEVAIEPDLPAGGSYQPGDDLSFRLSTDLTDVLADQNTGAFVVGLATDGGERRIWIVTANAIRARLDIASQYNIGGMTINQFAAPGNDPALAQAITEFKVRSASTVPGQLIMQWVVADASGALLSESTGLGTPWVWRAGSPGNYTVQGAVMGARPFERGAVAVAIGTEPTEEVESQATQAATRPPTTVTPGPTSPPPSPTTPSTPPPSRGGAGSDGGGFELGGQVPGYIAHPSEMHAAGMRWVKFQQKWSPGMDPSAVAGMIGAGHAAGFKVLISIPGPFAPTSIDYAGYVEFLRGVAAYQPDAIEVWNEMNLYTEWPRGQYSPTDYVNRMLAPGFNAIKSVSPNTMVIIGALAPTGVDDMDIAMADYRYLQGLAAAGAARYANCVGVHHNAGATPPSAGSGHPADGGGRHHSWYFRPTIDVYYSGLGGALPVCLTEFGYVSGEGYGELPGNWSWGSAITVADQAAWLAEGAQIARGLGYVRMMIIWNVDFTGWGSDPQAGYAIIRPDGTCPACAALGAVVR